MKNIFQYVEDQPKARILETVADIAAMQQAGMHSVRCPFFDPSTVFAKKSLKTADEQSSSSTTAVFVERDVRIIYP